MSSYRVPPLGLGCRRCVHPAGGTHRQQPDLEGRPILFHVTRQLVDRHAIGTRCALVADHALDTTPVVYTLINLPVCEPVGIVGRAMRYSLDTVRFYSCVAFLEGDRIERISSPLRQSLTQAWAENSHWKERWGIWWNLDSVMVAQQELQIFWRWLGTYSHLGLYSPSATSSRPKTSSRFIGWWWRSIAKAVGSVMGMRWLIIIGMRPANTPS